MRVHFCVPTFVIIVHIIIFGGVVIRQWSYRVFTFCLVPLRYSVIRKIRAQKIGPKQCACSCSEK